LWSMFAFAEVPLPVFPECGEPDRPDLCPVDLDEDWDKISYVPEKWKDTVRPEEHSLGTGLWADRAWRVTTGRTDVVIAVLDSGIEWDNTSLLRKHWLNADELPLPEGSSTHDANGDGVFNIDDYAGDTRVTSHDGDDAADSVLDPSDLIAVFSDGVDDDVNGYVDDISGWDFFFNDNNPYDDTRYGHGTGEAKDSAEEGGNSGGIGVCPNCMVLNLRVADSFIAEGSSFASGVIYAVDNGASVVQEALGALTNSDYVRESIDYAWDNGVTLIASAADENHWHHNLPGVNHHTVYVHALRHDAEDRDLANTFLSYSNCTNHGPRLVLSAPSTSCSSGATGVTSGVAGLLHSAALDVGLSLTSNETHQLLALTADDVDVPDALPDWYPSKAGWDRYFGYGRVNAALVVEAVVAGEIPPEADLLTPRWFEVIDPLVSTSLEVAGLVRATRSSVASWSLQWAVGEEPDEDQFIEVASGTEAVEGELATLDLAELGINAEAELPRWEVGDDQIDRETGVNIFTVTLRLQVVDTDGLAGEMRKAFYVRRDSDRIDGFPIWLGGSLESSPVFVDIDGDGVMDITQADGNGRVHAMNGAGEALDGWPVLLEPLEEVEEHKSAPGFVALGSDPRESVMATPAVGDLDGDGVMEVVVAGLRGGLYLFGSDGVLRAGFPVYQEVARPTSPDVVLDEGFFSSPALGDLDGDDDLEIVIGGMDQQVYAWHHDGSDLSGWPVRLAFPGEEENGARIISSPALGDLDQDGLPEVVIGTNELVGSSSAAVYALDGDGSALAGWPIVMFGLANDLLPFVGEGMPNSPALADITGDGVPEVIINAIAGMTTIVAADGEQLRGLPNAADGYGWASNANGASNTGVIHSPAVGDLNGDGVPDIVNGGTGINYLLAQQDDGFFQPLDHVLNAWDGATGDYLGGFPQVIEDLQFFLNPSIADIDGDGRPEALAGTGGYLVHAWNADGEEPAGWPKFTGQWNVATPAVGDVDGDGYLEVGLGTRGGWFWLWRTPSPAGATVEWAGFGHDAHNTSSYETPLVGYNSGYPLKDQELGGQGKCGCGTGGGGGWIVLLPSLFLMRRR
ncbi:MAG: hypothetical protein HN348_12150, partial [Proteobacteria bacterium]|nr:hypothetical protein [Pseudomonadota bacterium]